MSDRSTSPSSSSSTPSLSDSRTSSTSQSSFPSSPKLLPSAMPPDNKPRPPSLALSRDSPVFFSDSGSDELSSTEPLIAAAQFASLAFATGRPVRPPLMPRQTSYSKRHASFDTPREVPMPPDSPVSQTRSEKRQSIPAPAPFEKADSSGSTATIQQVQVVRPEMTPDVAQLEQYFSSISANHSSSSPSHSQLFLADRLSTASLLLPSNTPVSYLPSLSPTGEVVASTSCPQPPTDTTLNKTECKEENAKVDEHSRQTAGRPHTPPRPAMPPQRHSDSADPKQMNAQPPSLFSAVPPSAPPIKAKRSAPSYVSPFPPPEPPHIHPPPSPSSLERTASNRSAAHDTFLPHQTAQADGHSIAVESQPSEYRLHVKLPGYKRDCITLATRRRRILHVMADSWEKEGGHFERRISFGYDADLTQVRAEFDGDTLQIIVPRRSLNPYPSNN